MVVEEIQEWGLVSIAEPLIPHEVIIEILSWLSVKDLLRCKCVCKQWYDLMQDRYFIEKHIVHGVVMENFTCIPLMDDHETDDNKIFYLVGATDGLCMYTDMESGSYEIRNKAIHQTLYLPKPRRDCCTIGVAFFYIRSTGEYKVVHVHCEETSKNEKTRMVYCEVYTVGDPKNSWRPLDTHISLEFCQTKHYPVVYAPGGTVHFMRFVEIDHGSYKVKEIISLDLESECFTTSSFPQDFCSDFKKVRIMNWNDWLSFVEIVGDKMDVLILEDCKKHRWSKKLVVLKFMKEEKYKWKKPKPFTARFGKLWFGLNKQVVLAYDLKSKRIEEPIFPRPYEGNRNRSCYHFSVPTLVTLKGMRPEKDQKEKVEEILREEEENLKTMKKRRKKEKKKAKRKLEAEGNLMGAVLLLSLFWIGCLNLFFLG